VDLKGASAELGTDAPLCELSLAFWTGQDISTSTEVAISPLVSRNPQCGFRRVKSQVGDAPIFFCGECDHHLLAGTETKVGEFVAADRHDKKSRPRQYASLTERNRVTLTISITNILSSFLEVQLNEGTDQRAGRCRDQDLYPLVRSNGGYPVTSRRAAFVSPRAKRVIVAQQLRRVSDRLRLDPIPADQVELCVQLLNLTPIQPAQRGQRCVKSDDVASAERSPKALDHVRAPAMIELREQLGSRSSIKQPIVCLNDMESELIQQCLSEH